MSVAVEPISMVQVADKKQLPPPPNHLNHQEKQKWLEVQKKWLEDQKAQLGRRFQLLKQQRMEQQQHPMGAPSTPKVRMSTKDVHGNGQIVRTAITTVVCGFLDTVINDALTAHPATGFLLHRCTERARPAAAICSLSQWSRDMR